MIPAMVVVACGGTLWGGHNSYVALRNRAPLEIRCADYLRRRPDAAWLRLTNCYPDFTSMAVESFTTKGAGGRSLTEVSAVYIPLRAVRGTGEALTRILLVGNDDDLRPLGSDIPTAPSEQLVAELSTMVEGVIEDGLVLNQRRKAELAKMHLHLRLADDFVILDRGARPRPLWFALGELGLGIAVLALLVRRIRRWSRRGPSLPRARLARVRVAAPASDASEHRPSDASR